MLNSRGPEPDSRFLQLETGEPTVDRLETDDFDELFSFIKPWKTRINQLSPGQFNGTIWYAETGGMLFINAKCNQSIQFTGHTKTGCFALLPVHSGNFKSRFRTNRLPLGNVNILNPNEPANHVSACGFQTSQFEIPVEVVQRIGFEKLNVDAASLLMRPISIPIGQENCDYFNSELCAELERLAMNPDDRSSDRLIRLARELVVCVLENADPKAEFPTELDHRRRQFHQAVAIMKNGIGRALKLPEICASLDISERNLNMLFHDFANRSPKRYFNALRLNQVRRELKRVGDSVPISEITHGLGIEYSGVFARTYREHFGELPSATIRRGIAHVL